MSLITGTLDVVAFRDSDTSSSIYITYTADDDSLERHLRTWDIKTFVARTAFFDEDGRPRAYYADTLDADSLPRDAARDRRSNQLEKRYTLPFDSYCVSFCFEDERALTQSLVSAQTSTLRYLGGSLALSDILLHTTFTPATNPVIHRRHKSFSVNRRRAYTPSEKLHLYIELYNLSLSDGRCDYEVTYSIYEADTTSSRRQRIGRAINRLFPIGTPSHAIISQSFQRTGTSDVASEELAIDIHALEPGDYVLAVSAMDRIFGEWVRVSRSFVKLRSAVNRRGP